MLFFKKTEHYLLDNVSIGAGNCSITVLPGNTYFVIAVVLLASLGASVARLSGESVWKTGLWYAGLCVAGALVNYCIGLQMKTVFGIA